MLTGSLLVAAVNGSPYETLKNAIFDAMAYDNVTIEGQVQMTFNGEIMESERIHMIISETGSLEFLYNLNGDDHNGRFSYITDGLRINSQVYTDGSGNEWYSAWVSPWASPNGFMIGAMPENRDSAQFRFMELLLDIMVGDLQNHITMSTSGGVRNITGTITHNQLPEIVRLGLDVLIEENQRWSHNTATRDSFRNPWEIPMRAIHFNRIHGDAQVDAAGNLLYLHGYISMSVTNIFGDVNTMEFVLDFNFLDIGTSTPQSPVPGAAELFTHEFMLENFGVNTRNNPTLHFLRNADGTINEDSITTTWPGQRH